VSVEGTSLVHGGVSAAVAPQLANSGPAHLTSASPRRLGAYWGSTGGGLEAYRRRPDSLFHREYGVNQLTVSAGRRDVNLRTHNPLVAGSSPPALLIFCMSLADAKHSLDEGVERGRAEVSGRDGGDW
jgi:hypothetical protein